MLQQRRKTRARSVQADGFAMEGASPMVIGVVAPSHERAQFWIRNNAVDGNHYLAITSPAQVRGRYLDEVVWILGWQEAFGAKWRDAEMMIRACIVLHGSPE